jgi:hypothetical protein
MSLAVDLPMGAEALLAAVHGGHGVAPCGTVSRRPGLPSIFPPPDARPRGTGRNGRGRRGTAEAVGGLFVHVTSDDRDEVGMGRDPRRRSCDL